MLPRLSAFQSQLLLFQCVPHVFWVYWAFLVLRWYLVRPGDQLFVFFMVVPHVVYIYVAGDYSGVVIGYHLYSAHICIAHIKAACDFSVFWLVEWAWMLCYVHWKPYASFSHGRECAPSHCSLTPQIKMRHRFGKIVVGNSSTGCIISHAKYITQLSHSRSEPLAEQVGKIYGANIELCLLQFILPSFLTLCTTLISIPRTTDLHIADLRICLVHIRCCFSPLWNVLSFAELIETKANWILGHAVYLPLPHILLQV